MHGMQRIYIRVIDGGNLNVRSVIAISRVSHFSDEAGSGDESTRLAEDRTAKRARSIDADLDGCEHEIYGH